MKPNKLIIVPPPRRRRLKTTKTTTSSCLASLSFIFAITTNILCFLSKLKSSPLRFSTAAGASRYCHCAASTASFTLPLFASALSFSPFSSCIRHHQHHHLNRRNNMSHEQKMMSMPQRVVSSSSCSSSSSSMTKNSDGHDDFHSSLWNEWVNHNHLEFHHLDPETSEKIQSALLEWYYENRRKLPWRGDAPPYDGSTAGFTTSATATAKKNSKMKQESNISRKNQQQTKVDSFFQSKKTATKEPTPPEETLSSSFEESAIPVTGYGVWVSEIMLQQTRVEAVIPYWIKCKYLRFYLCMIGMSMSVNDLLWMSHSHSHTKHTKHTHRDEILPNSS